MFVPRRSGVVTCGTKCSKDRNLRLKKEAVAASRAAGWSLSVDPFAAGLVRDWEGRRPDWATGF